MKEIKNTTIYDYDTVKRFLKIFYFEKTKVIRLIINILIVMVIVRFFTTVNKTILDYITFIISIFGIVEMNTGFIPAFNALKLSKKKNSIINSKIEYLFKKNNLKISTKNEYVDYDKLYKVIETNTNYYLYINTSKAFIVDKTNMSEENIDYLTKKFKEKVSTYKYKK